MPRRPRRARVLPMMNSSRCDGMDREIKFRIPLAPVTKKNSQRIMTRPGGRRFVAPSEAYIAYERDAVWFIPKGVCINEPVNIRAIFRMPTRRRVDLTNLLEALDDILVKAGLLSDDNSLIVAAHDGSRVVYDKANPGTEVTITKMEAGADDGNE